MIWGRKNREHSRHARENFVYFWSFYWGSSILEPCLCLCPTDFFLFQQIIIFHVTMNISSGGLEKVIRCGPIHLYFVSATYYLGRTRMLIPCSSLVDDLLSSRSVASGFVLFHFRNSCFHCSISLSSTALTRANSSSLSSWALTATLYSSVVARVLMREDLLGCSLLYLRSLRRTSWRLAAVSAEDHQLFAHHCIYSDRVLLWLVVMLLESCGDGFVKQRRQMGM
jgi:hypothetical protein